MGFVVVFVVYGVGGFVVCGGVELGGEKWVGDEFVGLVGE